MFFSTEEEEPLPWEIRVKIAIGVARGVEFIHFIKNKPLFRKLRMYNIMHDEVMVYLHLSFIFCLLS